MRLIACRNRMLARSSFHPVITRAFITEVQGAQGHAIVERVNRVASNKIRFSPKLLRPAASAKGGSWTFLILPKDASAKLPSRGMTTVEGTINGVPFKATLEPDGRKSHWLKVDRKVREAAGADAGDIVTLELVPEPLEPTVPSDLRKALAAAPKARSVWSDITPIARTDWIHWITSAKQPETRARRVDSACSMLAAGKRRVCCFDRSGSIANASALLKRRSK